MRTRLEDLIATADRQLASRSYDAAIDTYRTALGEPGATEAGVMDRLEAACRVRDEALGIVRAVETPAPPPVEPPVELAAPPAIETGPVPVPEPEPAPTPQRQAAFRTIEPPAFHLIEDDPSMLERPSQDSRDRDRYADIEVRSILDPTPAPEELALTGTATRLVIALVIAIVVVVVAYYAK